MNYKDLKSCMSRRYSGKDKEYIDTLFDIIDEMCVASVDRDKCFVGDVVYSQDNGLEFTIVSLVHTDNGDGMMVVLKNKKTGYRKVSETTFKRCYTLYNPGMASEANYSNVDSIVRDSRLSDDDYCALWDCTSRDAHLKERMKGQGTIFSLSQNDISCTVEPAYMRKDECDKHRYPF